MTFSAYSKSELKLRLETLISEDPDYVVEMIIDLIKKNDDLILSKNYLERDIASLDNLLNESSLELDNLKKRKSKMQEEFIEIQDDHVFKIEELNLENEKLRKLNKNIDNQLITLKNKLLDLEVEISNKNPLNLNNNSKTEKRILRSSTVSCTITDKKMLEKKDEEIKQINSIRTIQIERIKQLNKENLDLRNHIRASNTLNSYLELNKNVNLGRKKNVTENYKKFRDNYLS